MINHHTCKSKERVGIVKKKANVKVSRQTETNRQTDRQTDSSALSQKIFLSRHFRVSDRHQEIFHSPCKKKCKASNRVRNKKTTIFIFLLFNLDP